MDTRNSQKKSPRSSAKNERSPRAGEETHSRHHPSWVSQEDAAKYLDGSPDAVRRIHEAKKAAQRDMESFGDVSEYEVTVLQGQCREESIAASQPSLDFPGDVPGRQQEKA